MTDKGIEAAARALQESHGLTGRNFHDDASAAIAAYFANAEPVEMQWCAYEDGHQRTSWKSIGSGDEAGWKALEKRRPEKYRIATQYVFAAPEDRT